MTVTVSAGLSLPWCSTRIKTNFSFMEHFLGLFRDISSVLFPQLFPWSDLWAPVPLLLVSHSSSSAHTSGGAHHCPSGGVSSCLWVIPFDSFYSNPGWAILALVHIWSMCTLCPRNQIYVVVVIVFPNAAVSPFSAARQPAIFSHLRYSMDRSDTSP